MKLICYLKDRSTLDIRPAPLSRGWMDESVNRFAYRCLPLNIANTHGWEICCEEPIEAIWNGGNQNNDIKIISGSERIAISHFGSGVLTFHIPCVFRTEENWNLMVMPPPNRPKRGIQALTGIIETDWAPYGFTMNWIFTEPNYPVKFDKGEAFCFFFPIERGVIEKVDPLFCDMRTNSELDLQHGEWTQSRQNFLNDLANPYSQATQDKWQRKYFQGQYMNGQAGTEFHQTKVRAKPFRQSQNLTPEANFNYSITIEKV